MQSGKKAAEAMKESAANVGATALSGMEKTKATMQGMGEKMTARSQAEKDIAERRKEEKKAEAELNKREVKELNAEQKRVNIADCNAGTGIGGNGYGNTGTGGYGR